MEKEKKKENDYLQDSLTRSGLFTRFSDTDRYVTNLPGVRFLG